MAHLTFCLALTMMVVATSSKPLKDIKNHGPKNSTAIKNSTDSMYATVAIFDLTIIADI